MTTLFQNEKVKKYDHIVVYFSKAISEHSCFSGVVFKKKSSVINSNVFFYGPFNTKDSPVNGAGETKQQCQIVVMLLLIM